MKYQFTVLIFFLFLFGCNKDNGSVRFEKDSNCIEQIVVPVHQHDIADSDVQTVNDLFLNSHIDNSNLRYYQYLHDSVQTYYPPYAKFDSKTVRVDQYTNGLRIFNAQMVFDWYNNVFDYKGGNPTSGTNLDTKPELTLLKLRELFIDDIERFDRKGSLYQDSCFKAEFGYYDLNAESNNASEKLVKAWRVTLLNAVAPCEFPVAYYQDNSGELIYYDDGVRTFR